MSHAPAGDIDRDELSGAVDLPRVAPITRPLSMRQLSAATRLAVDLGHPAYDCFCPALAIHEQYPVVTADARFYKKVRDHPYLSYRIAHVADIGQARPRP